MRPEIVGAIAAALAFPTACAWFLLKNFVGRFNGKLDRVAENLDKLSQHMEENTQAQREAVDAVRVVIANQPRRPTTRKRERRPA